MSDHFQLSSSLSSRDGFLFCEEVKVKDLQDALVDLFPYHSSPFFVYSQRQLIENIKAYRMALDKSGISYSLGYSMKANYNPEIVRLLGQYGCWAVAVSGFEVKLAVQQGIRPENVILNGNGKQKWEIENAVNLGCLINIDSAFDLQHIADVANKLSRKVRVLIRLNPDIDADVHPFLATGLAKSKFGLEDEQLFDLLDVIKKNENIELLGLHCHLGSTIDNTFIFSECLDVMITLAEKVKQRGFNNISMLNLGGGLGINYRTHEHRTKNPCSSEKNVADDSFNMLLKTIQMTCHENSEEIVRILTISARSPSDFDQEKLKQLKALLGKHKDIFHDAKSIIPSIAEKMDIPLPSDLIASVEDRLKATGYHLILEPGRSLVGNTATFVTKVIGVKRNGKKRYVVVDGSMTEVIRPALYGAYHHIELTEPLLLTKPDQNEKLNRDVFDVVGPVCECTDFLGKDRWLPIPHEGCGLAVFDTGAYCSSMSLNFNMRPRPAELIVDGSSWRVIRNPETFESILGSFVQG